LSKSAPFFLAAIASSIALSFSSFSFCLIFLVIIGSLLYLAKSNTSFRFILGIYSSFFNDFASFDFPDFGGPKIEILIG